MTTRCRPHLPASALAIILTLSASSSAVAGSGLGRGVSVKATVSSAERGRHQVTLHIRKSPRTHEWGASVLDGVATGFNPFFLGKHRSDFHVDEAHVAFEYHLHDAQHEAMSGSFRFGNLLLTISDPGPGRPLDARAYHAGEPGGFMHRAFDREASGLATASVLSPGDITVLLAMSALPEATFDVGLVRFEWKAGIGLFVPERRLPPGTHTLHGGEEILVELNEGDAAPRRVTSN